MNWETLNILQFRQAVADGRGVCLLPMGCLEKHGDHLPLGTDLFFAREVALRAAENEPAVVFPGYPFGQISEARHLLGTVALEARLQMELMQALCGEIARNGLGKIIIVNAHGGSISMLRYFAQTQLDKRRGFTVYFFQCWPTAEQQRQLNAVHGAPDGEGHADIHETSFIMSQNPALARMENVKVEESRPLGRLRHLRDVFTGIGWYADYPCQFAGNPIGATPERGAALRDCCVENLVAAIRAVKSDDSAAALQKEFFDRCDAPGV